LCGVQVWRMRTGISITISPAARRHLQDLVRDRNAARKHVRRARIVLLTADGLGTNPDHTAHGQIEDLRLDDGSNASWKIAAADGIKNRPLKIQ
jgi:hypothetical protein